MKKHPTRKKVKKDLKTALNSSEGFANPYGEEDYPEEGPLEQGGGFEELSEDDDEFDFAIQNKKEIRHQPW